MRIGQGDGDISKAAGRLGEYELESKYFGKIKMGEIERLTRAGIVEFEIKTRCLLEPSEFPDEQSRVPKHPQ